MIKPALSDTAQVAVTTPAQSPHRHRHDGGRWQHALGADMLVITDYTENLAKVHDIP